jgi:hypothetical protein
MSLPTQRNRGAKDNTIHLNLICFDAVSQGPPQQGSYHLAPEVLASPTRAQVQHVSADGGEGWLEGDPT